MTAYDAMVLAGGAARRLGGVDKPGLTVAGRTLLDRVLDACADARTAVAVGPARETVRPDLRWTREDPPGGGPVAAIAAGLAGITADRVLVLAADLPFLDRRTVARLLAALAGETGGPTGQGADEDTVRLGGGIGPGPAGPTVTRPRQEGAVEAAILVDAAGRDQPLAGAYRTAALRAALAALGDPGGQSLRRLLAPLRTVRLADLDSVAYDCDTWEELDLARTRAQGRPA